MAWGAAWRRGHRSQVVRFLERGFLVGGRTSCARPVAAEGPRCGFCRGWRDWGGSESRGACSFACGYPECLAAAPLPQHPPRGLSASPSLKEPAVALVGQGCARQGAVGSDPGTCLWVGCPPIGPLTPPPSPSLTYPFLPALTRPHPPSCFLSPTPSPPTR